jgi:hypothetical protein
MANVAIEGSDLVVQLSFWEKIGALRSGVRVSLGSVRQARATSEPWAELRGIRAPGTGIPSVIMLGTTRGGFGKDFCAIYRGKPAVIVDLAGEEFRRLLLSVEQPEALVERILSEQRNAPRPNGG